MKDFRILCMIDFSEDTPSLLKYAVNLAAAYQAKLWVMHVYYIPIGYQGDVFIPSEALEAYEVQCQKDFQKLHSPYAQEGHQLHFMVRHGDVLGEANRLVEEEKIDLLIAGNRGGNLLVNILGNHTLKFIYHARCPVLTVPPTLDFRPFERVLLATDWGDTAAEKMEQLIKVILPLKPNLDVIHVAQKQDHTFQEINQEGLDLSQIPHTFYYLWESHIEDGLQQHIEDHRNDLIVMIPRHHNFFDRLFQKSITRQMTFHSKVPLLTIHA